MTQQTTNRMTIEVPTAASGRFQHLNGQTATPIQFSPTTEADGKDEEGVIEWRNEHTVLVQVGDRLWTIPTDWCRIIQTQPEAPRAAPSE